LSSILDTDRKFTQAYVALLIGEYIYNTIYSVLLENNIQLGFHLLYCQDYKLVKGIDVIEDKSFLTEKCSICGIVIYSDDIVGEK
jgi:hypothetical protein